MADLPANVDRLLTGFVDAARAALGADLRSVVLFGSAAQGQMRATSDVNVIVVLSAFDASRLDGLREPLRTAHAAIRLSPMFLLESEVPAAVQAFAVKFADVWRRRRVLHGADPFATLRPARSAEIARLKQVVLNLLLRLRQQYLLRSLREEQAALLVAEMAGPLRSSAAALLELQGRPAASPKAALETVARTLAGAAYDETLAALSTAREARLLAPGTAGPTVLRLIELAQAMRGAVEALTAEPP